MSVVYSVPETISQLTDLVRAGRIREARQVGKSLLSVADARQLWVIRRVADVLESRPRTAAALLKHWQETAPSPEDAAIIAACTPDECEQRRRPQADTGSAPRWNSRNKYQAPSTVRTEQRPELRRRRKSRQEQNDAAAFRRYAAERAGVAEGDQIPDRDDRARAEQVYADGLSRDHYEKEATRTLTSALSLPCVACTVERARYDLHGVAADDGLCAECRDAGRPGIGTLPPGHAMADAVAARYDLMREERGDLGTVQFLKARWPRFTPEVKAAVAAYVERAALSSGKTDGTGPAELAPCVSCPDARTARDLRGVAEDDGLCAACRAADADADECPCEDCQTGCGCRACTETAVA